jgi:hypothetical protein
MSGTNKIGKENNTKEHAGVGKSGILTRRISITPMVVSRTIPVYSWIRIGVCKFGLS